MSRYAAKTSVSAAKSRAEIEDTLARYGAESFAYIQKPELAVVQFVIGSLGVQFDLPMPNRDAPEFRFTPARRNERNAKEQYAAWEQACRQRWRALALAIKAKLEAVESGITTFEEEFLAHIVLPNGQTMGRYAIPQIRAGADSGEMPTNLLGWNG